MPAFSATNFDAFYVNLDHRTDRRAHMERQLARTGIRAERKSALHTPTRKSVGVKHPKLEAMLSGTPGAVGCYISQCECIRHAADSGRNTMVLEDDVVFCEDLRRRLEYIENRLPLLVGPSDWDIFWLGATFHCNPAVWHKGTIGRDAEVTLDPRIMRTFGIWSTYAYVVNASTAGRTLDLFDAELHNARGIDHLAILLGAKLRAYCFVPGCCWQYDNKSDIGTGGDGITRFSGFRRLGPYAWQDLMEEFDPSSFDWAECAPAEDQWKTAPYRDPWEQYPHNRPMPHPGAR